MFYKNKSKTSKMTSEIVKEFIFTTFIYFITYVSIVKAIDYTVRNLDNILDKVKEYSVLYYFEEDNYDICNLVMI